MDPYDSVKDNQAIHDTLFQPPLVIPPSSPNRTLVLPAIGYALDHTETAADSHRFQCQSCLWYREVPPRGAVAYYNVQGLLQPRKKPEPMKTDRTGYTRWPADPAQGGISLIERIDVG